jgi:hypothetical protein
MLMSASRPEPVDLGHHPLARRGIGASNRRSVDGCQVGRLRHTPRSGAHAPDLHHMGQHRYPELMQERAAEAPDRDTRGRLAGARALEHVADVVEPVLQRPHQIGVPGTRPREARTRVRVTLHCHQVAVLLLPFRVRDRDRDGRAEGATMANPRDHVEAVGFEPLTPSATVPVAPARQVSREPLG